MSEAISLKNKIDTLKGKQTNIEDEKLAIGIIGNQFNNYAEQIGSLTAAVQDIWDNWFGVQSAINNIKEYVDKINPKQSPATIDDWKDVLVLNDLLAVREVIKTLDAAISTMEFKTNIYTNCDLSKCSTREEMIKTLKEFVEKLKQNDKGFIRAIL